MIRPLTLRQVYGLNPKVPALDLTREGDPHDTFVYVSGNLTLIQQGDEQIILHGHTNNVSALDVSNDKSMVITAEKSTIIIWLVAELSPAMIFENDRYVPISIKFNKDASMFASLDTDGVVRVYKTDNPQPIFEHQTKRHYGFEKIQFCSEDSSCFAVYGLSSVMFFEINETLEFSKCQKLADSNINANINAMSFLRNDVDSSDTSRAWVAGMSNGSLVIFKGNSHLNLSYNSHIKITGESESITALKLVSQNTLAVGSSYRRVRFYDTAIKLKNWISNKQILPGIHGNITSISLKYQPGYNPDKISQPTDNPKLAETTLKGKSFFTTSLLVTTTHGEIVRINADATTDHEKKSSVLTHGKIACKINAFACHTNQNIVAIALENCNNKQNLIELYDYENERQVMKKKIQLHESELISCISFDKQSVFLAFGTNKGRFFILDSLTLEEKFKFLLSTRESGSVERIVFNGNWCAVSDSTFAVSVFKINNPDKGENSENSSQFQYHGRSRSHVSKIASIIIEEDLLISIGNDRYMVEYDLNSITYEGEQSVLYPKLEPTRLEQTERPLDAVLHPTIKSKSSEKFLLTVTNGHKLRIFNTKTRLARKTTLAPLCGSDINNIRIVPNNEILAFSSGSKIGLIQLPSDGNPWKQTAILAHPTGVECIEPSYCGNYLFSLAKNIDKHGCLRI